MSHSTAEVTSLKSSIRDRIVAILTESSPTLLKTNELSKKLGIKSESEEYQLVREVLEELQDRGIIFKGPRRRYGRVVPDTSVEGELRMIDSSRWVIVPIDGREPVLKLDRDEIWTAFHGDLVRARPLSIARAGEIPWGEVTRLLERRTTRIVGTLKQGRELYLHPDSKKIHCTITIPRKHVGKAKIGDKVVVELFEWKDPDLEPTGKIVRRIGQAGEMGAELESILEEYNVRIDFPDDVIAESEAFPEHLTKEDWAGRRDYRDKPVFTIDPHDARDFDDAISLERHDNGEVTLGVHIADVGHYVAEGSALDKEAYMRGTSIYLVNGVIPMLPERLSNNLCSLRPNEDRLAYSLLARLSPGGAVKDYEIAKTVIRSQRRFTYEEALEILESGTGEFSDDLLAINQLVQALRRNRRRKGAIDFATTELKFKLDDEGKPVEVIPKRANESTRLIEDCMLLANRIVAQHIAQFKHLERRKRGSDRNPFIYRIHDVPPKDKLIELAYFVKQFGYQLPVDNLKPKDFQRLIDSARERGHEHLITEVALRSMAKAVYSEHNIGHFGLAYSHYTHFTSPIRRYPDLIVHRMLHEYQRGMKRERLDDYQRKIGWIADQSSGRERAAVEAERASIKIAEVEYLSNHIGDTYEATIISVLPFGMFAELNDLGIQGLIPTRSIGDDLYRFDEGKKELVGRRSRKRYRMGDKVFVRVVKVDEVNAQIDLGLMDEKEYRNELEGEKPLAQKKWKSEGGNGPVRKKSTRKNRRKGSEIWKEKKAESKKRKKKKKGR